MVVTVRGLGTFTSTVIVYAPLPCGSVVVVEYVLNYVEVLVIVLLVHFLTGVKIVSVIVLSVPVTNLV